MSINKFTQTVQLIVEYDVEGCYPTDVRVVINDKFDIPLKLDSNAIIEFSAAAKLNEENLKSWNYLENEYRDMTGESVVIKDEFHAQRIREKLSDDWREFNKA